MTDKSLTFLSSRGAGLNADMKLVESYLTGRGEFRDMSYRFYIKNDRVDNPVVRQGLLRAKKQFCANLQNVVCADASLPTNAALREAEGVRILLATPYDYQYRVALQSLKEGNKKTARKAFRNFTHIIPGSPFCAELLRNGYDLDGVELVEDVCLPFVWELSRPDGHEDVMNRLRFYFPEIEEKKVFALMIYGEAEKKNNFLRDFDINKLMHRLGDGWFVLTNNEEVMDKAYTLGAKYRGRFGYVNKIMLGHEILHVADVVVTNSGRIAANFSTRKKPVYCPDFRRNNFEKYMRECYPDMFVSTVTELFEKELSDEKLSDAQKRFGQQFTYEKLKSPYEVICELLSR